MPTATLLPSPGQGRPLGRYAKVGAAVAMDFPCRWRSHACQRIAVLQQCFTGCLFRQHLVLAILILQHSTLRRPHRPSQGKDERNTPSASLSVRRDKRVPNAVHVQPNSQHSQHSLSRGVPAQTVHSSCVMFGDTPPYLACLFAHALDLPMAPIPSSVDPHPLSGTALFVFPVRRHPFVDQDGGGAPPLHGRGKPAGTSAVGDGPRRRR